MAALLLLALLFGDPDPPGQVVIIRLYVPAEMTQPFALETRDVATRLLVPAGLTPIWLICPSRDRGDRRCELPIDPAEIIVRTLPGRASRDVDRCAETYLPRAGGGQMITLFADCSAAIARNAPVSAAHVHAHMLVHELGHLLMGPAHSVDGIMQYPLELHDWFMAAFGTLTFTPSQRSALRRGAAERWSTPIPAPSATPSSR